MNFEASLPKPNSVTLENQLTALETYGKALDATLDAYISDKFFTTDVGGDVAGQVATMKEILKAYFLRQWLTENGVMTELSSLTTLGPDAKPVIDVWTAQASHVEALTKSLTNLMAKLQPIKDASNTVMQNLTGGDTSSTEETPPADDASGGEDDFGSGDEGGDDFGGEEEDATTEDATPVDDASAGEETPKEDKDAEKDKKDTDDKEDKKPDGKKEDEKKGKE